MADYRSRIRGGHNFYNIRVSDQEVAACLDPPQLLLALTPETIDVHLEQTARGAVIIYDQGFQVDPERIRSSQRLPFPIPLAEIAKEHGSKVMMNTAALAAAAALLDLPMAPVESVIRQNFASKGERVVAANLDVARAANAFASAHRPQGVDLHVPIRAGEPPRMVLNGNEAFSLGALLGGCRFVAQYPMTPATTILEWMTAHAAETGVVTKHAEDEIAAVCMAIGASWTGARAMTATSGGGFALMAEAVGLAAMTETPLVAVISQRGGPSTGLPTRTEQGDLLFVLRPSQGDFPLIITAPGSHEQAWETGWRSFNLAERYQCPVLVLLDEYLSSALTTLPMTSLDPAPVRIDRGETYAPDQAQTWLRRSGERAYARFRFTESGISPRLLPGDPAAVYTVSSDEHDETGAITEDQENRTRMMEKRMHKLDAALGEMRGPARYGAERAEITLLCWGSTLGAALEASELLRRRGTTVNVLHWTDLWPFPAAASLRELGQVRHGVVIEQNYSGQFEQLLRMTTGYQPERHLRKYDGRAFTSDEIASWLEQEVLSYVD